MVDPSALTDISSPSTPPGTSVATMAPLCGSSLTSAPAVVTATTPGRGPAGAGLGDETTTGALLPGGGVTVTVLRGAAVPPLLHAVSSARAGTTDAISSASREERRTAADMANLGITQG
jgi:hypothetical protein